MQLNLMTT